jgi:uncharacterized delta-60 repeat protein
MVTLGNRDPSMPSVLYLDTDGTFLVGEAAARNGVTNASRVAREFKRRLGDPTPMLVGGTPLSAHELLAQLLHAVVKRVADVEGGAPEHIVVCRPANWGVLKQEQFAQALRLADVGSVSTITEPEAAALHYAQRARVNAGQVFAVYDFGGGTFDATVLARTKENFELRGTPTGIEQLGGVDIDSAVCSFVNDALDGVLDSADQDDPDTLVALQRLRDDCVKAKEVLSFDSSVSIPVALPTLHTDVVLTRTGLEALIEPMVRQTIACLRAALRSAEVVADDLAAVLLVGGSSRIPLVDQMLRSELGRPVAIDTHPKHSVALGAAVFAAATGDTPAPAGAVAVTPAAARPGAAAPVTVDSVTVNAVAERPRRITLPTFLTRSRRLALGLGTVAAVLLSALAVAAWPQPTNGTVSLRPTPPTTSTPSTSTTQGPTNVKGETTDRGAAITTRPSTAPPTTTPPTSTPPTTQRAGPDPIVSIQRDGAFGGGIVEDSFGGHGDLVDDIVVARDDKLVVVGSKSSTKDGVVAVDFGVARYNKDGTRDPTFNNNGVFVDDIGIEDLGRAAVPLSNGGLIIGGRSDDKMVVERLSPNGSLDGTFGVDGRAEFAFGEKATALALAALKDGVAVAGVADNEFAVTKLDDSGRPDATFHGGQPSLAGAGKGTVASAVAQLPGGELLAVGGGTGGLVVARYSADGSLDRSFGDAGRIVLGKGNDFARAVIVDKQDGRITVGGLLNGRPAILRLERNGDRVANFGANGVAQVDLGGPPRPLLGIAPDGTGFTAMGHGANGTVVLTTFNERGSQPRDSNGSPQVVLTGLSNGRAKLVGTNSTELYAGGHSATGFTLAHFVVTRVSALQAAARVEGRTVTSLPAKGRATSSESVPSGDPIATPATTQPPAGNAVELPLVTVNTPKQSHTSIVLGVVATSALLAAGIGVVLARRRHLKTEMNTR